MLGCAKQQMAKQPEGDVRLKVLFLFLILKRWGRPSRAVVGAEGGSEALERGGLPVTEELLGQSESTM